MAIYPVYPTGAVGGSTTTNFTLTPPASSAIPGDVAIIVVAQRQLTNGVTKVGDTATGLLLFTLLRFGAQATTASTTIYYRVLQSGDPGVGNLNTWTVTVTAATEGALMAYSGVDNVNPIDVQGTTTTTSSAVATFNTLTTDTNNAYFIGAFAGNYATNPLTTQASGTTQTLRANGSNAGATATKQGVAIVDNIVTPAGASGAPTWNLSASNNWATDTFALLPATTLKRPNVFNNYAFVSDNAGGDTGILSFSEKIR